MGRYDQRKKKWGDIIKERKNREVLPKKERKNREILREEKKKESQERKKKWKAI